MQDSQQPQDRRNLNYTILSLLEENREDMKHLHRCIHETKELVADIQTHFIGITPEVHIRHHNNFVQMAEDSKAKKALINKILATAAATILASAATAFLAWVYTSEYDKLKTQAAAHAKAELDASAHEDKNKP